MSAERDPLSGAFQDDPRSLPSIIPAKEAPMPSKSCDSLAQPFIPAGPEASLATPSERSRDSLARPFIPAGPSTALAMPPILRRRAVT
jgi:hypothetical protein